MFARNDMSLFVYRLWSATFIFGGGADGTATNVR